jgi:uncharacterized coiled-coil protein SlyX
VADQIDVGPPSVPLRDGKSYKGIALFVVLLALGAAAGFTWLRHGDRLLEVTSLASSAGSSAAVAATDASLVAASDFQSFQQQTAEALQSVTELLTAQQAQLKRLSDDVSGLSTKIDQMQSTLASGTTASLPPARLSVTVPRRKPPTPRPAGAISVGGAPLVAPPQPVR